MRASTRTLLTGSFLLLIAGSGLACGAPAPSATPSPQPLTPGPSSPSGAPAKASPAPPSQSPADTAPVAVTLSELEGAASDFDGRRVIVSGFYVGTPQGQVLCELLLESYPPQAGGAMVGLVGQMPPEILARLESTADEPDLATVTWGSVEIIGTFHAVGGGATGGTLEMEEVRIAEF